jgi:hypothetical protein
MEPKGLRITISYDGDATTFERVLATVVNPLPIHLASTARLDDGVARCTFMLRHRAGLLTEEAVDETLARVSGRYTWSDVELVSLTGAPVDTRPGIDTAA